MAKLTAQDRDLIRAAKRFLSQRYTRGKHHVACALQCGNKTYLSLHLDSQGFDVCAEPIALSNALYEKEINFETIVSVAMGSGKETHIIPPCGNCRQILIEYTPKINVIVQKPGSLETIKISELLPLPYGRITTE